MIDLILLASIVATSRPAPATTPAPAPVTVPAPAPVTTPTPKPSYVTPPPAPAQSWSDKMWQRYKENSK